MDKKYLRDYSARVQKILREEYGIHLYQKTILKINIFLFKNIVTALMKGAEVRIRGFIYWHIHLFTRDMLRRKKNRIQENPLKPGS